MVTPGQLAQRADLYFQLSQLSTAGIPLLQCLDSVGASPRVKLRPALMRLRMGLEEGHTLADAIEPLGAWFSHFERALLDAAEQSGRLPETFRQLFHHYEEKAATARQVIALTAYPALLFHLAVLIFPIEALTGLVLKGQWVQFLFGKAMMLGPLYALVLLAVYLSQETRSQSWRTIWDGLLHSIPVLGSARRDLALARLSASLDALIRAGVPIIQAWRISGPASGSPRFNRSVQRMVPQMEAGRPPSEVLRQDHLFPDIFTNQYAAGELSGKLDENLNRLHQYYLEEGNRRMRRTVLVAGGLLYAGIVLMVVWRVLSFYIDYFRKIGEFIPD